MNSVLNEQRNVYPSIYNIYTPASLMNLLSFFWKVSHRPYPQSQALG